MLMEAGVQTLYFIKEANWMEIYILLYSFVSF